MGVFHRMSLVFQQKANAALDKAEDPTEALDLSYQKLLEQLQQVRKAIADVLTSEKRLEGQRTNLQAQVDKLQGQARQALGQGQEALARTALQRADTIQQQIDALGPQIDQLKNQESQLQVMGQKLQAKVEAFRAQRDTMKAQYTAAKASTQAIEGMSGLSEQMADVSMMLDRAQDKVAQMQARSSAVGELADSGVLDSVELSPGGGDDIDAQLRQGAGGVDAQLAALKAQMAVEAASGPAGAIGTGTGTASAAPPTGAPGAGTAGSSAPSAGNAPGGNPSAGNAPGGNPPAGGAPGNETKRPVLADLVVRIAGEDQYQVRGAVRPALDGLDSALANAIETGDAESFTQCTTELAKLIKANGTVLPHDDLRPSELIVPSPSMSLEEAKRLLSDPQAQATA
jgi:phage shock protein A